jgi:hypothetical protein
MAAQQKATALERKARHIANPKRGSKLLGPARRPLAPVPLSPVAALPFKTGLSFYANRIDGGVKAMMPIVRLSEDPKVRNVAERWDLLSEPEKRVVPLEQLCFEAEVRQDVFIGEFIKAAFRENMNLSKITAAMAHPDVVQASIDAAKTPDGKADRAMLFKHSGFLPERTGGNIFVNAQARAESKAAAISESSGLPSFEESMTEFLEQEQAEP